MSSPDSPAPQPLDPRIVSALAHPAGAREDAPPALRAEYPPEADVDPRVGVEHIQTHLSHVFLTRSRVYKLRKAVRFEFVDFGTRAERIADCVREVELNRRLAPAVYLGLAPIRIEPGPSGDRVRVGTLSESPEDAAEHCVVMQRLPSGRDAASLLERGELGPAHLDATARTIARFHRSHPLVASVSADVSAARDPALPWARSVEAPVLDNFGALRELAPPTTARALEQVERRAREFMRGHAPGLERRFAEGRCVDGHGDLHLQHVWFLPGDTDPTIIDCAEFRESFRQLDRAAEVAFLAMDLRYRGHPELAEHFLASYARESDDYELYLWVDYFVSYRAMVRAKVAALAGRDPELDPTQRHATQKSVEGHVELAARALAQPTPGPLLLMTGQVGTGKSTVARALADALSGVPIVSDRVRKHLAGIDAMDRTDETWGSGIFGREMSDRTYAGLLERAEPVVTSGRAAILDASYPEVERRKAALDWARSHARTAVLVHVTCDSAVSAARLRERAERRDDPSDATSAHQAASRAGYVAPDEWPASQRIDVATDAPGWRETLHAALEERGWIEKR